MLEWSDEVGERHEFSDDELKPYRWRQAEEAPARCGSVDHEEVWRAAQAVSRLARDEARRDDWTALEQWSDAPDEALGLWLAALVDPERLELPVAEVSPLTRSDELEPVIAAIKRGPYWTRRFMSMVWRLWGGDGVLPRLLREVEVKDWLPDGPVYFEDIEAARQLVARWCIDRPLLLDEPGTWPLDMMSRRGQKMTFAMDWLERIGRDERGQKVIARLLPTKSALVRERCASLVAGTEGNDEATASDAPSTEPSLDWLEALSEVEPTATPEWFTPTSWPPITSADEPLSERQISHLLAALRAGDQEVARGARRDLDGDHFAETMAEAWKFVEGHDDLLAAYTALAGEAAIDSLAKNIRKAKYWPSNKWKGFVERHAAIRAIGQVDHWSAYRAALELTASLKDVKLHGTASYTLHKLCQRLEVDRDTLADMSVPDFGLEPGGRPELRLWASDHSDAGPQ